MMLQSTDRKFKLFFYLILFILLSTQIKRNENINNNFTTKIKDIVVVGLSNENNYKVYQNLKFLLQKNIFLLSKNDFQNILKENNLVDYFHIKKIYPNLIKIKIKQTELLAITNYQNKKFYIGSNGRLIAFDQIKKLNVNLPFVYSKSNYLEFIKLKKIIDESDFEFQQIESFYYFQSNRWDIKTKDGLLIKLPEKNLAESLKLAQLVKINKEINNKKIIDLRISNNIILSNE
mgnify:CR=1 FL=1